MGYLEDKNEILRYSTVPAIIELFDECYKMGVRHASIVDDAGEIMDFIENHREPSLYAVIMSVGTFGERRGVQVYDLRGWRLHLRILVSDRTTVCKRNTIDKYIQVVSTNSNYLGVVYDVCMDFYLLGLSHYISNQDCSVAAFDRKKHAVFGHTNTKKAATRTVDDYVRTVQQFCFDRAMKEGSKAEFGISMSRSRYDTFAMFFYNLVMGRRSVVKDINKLFGTRYRAFDKKMGHTHRYNLQRFEEDNLKDDALFGGASLREYPEDMLEGEGDELFKDDSPFGSEMLGMEEDEDGEEEDSTTEAGGSEGEEAPWRDPTQTW